MYIYTLRIYYNKLSNGNNYKQPCREYACLAVAVLSNIQCDNF